MAPLAHANAPFPSTAGLVRSGLTEDQAKAVSEMVHKTTVESVEVLKCELVRWHTYLALYMLIQIGIVLLVALMTQALRAPLPYPKAVLSGDPSCSRAVYANYKSGAPELSWMSAYSADADAAADISPHLHRLDAARNASGRTSWSGVYNRGDPWFTKTRRRLGRNEIATRLWEQTIIGMALQPRASALCAEDGLRTAVVLK